MVKNSMGGKKAKKMKNSGPVKRATLYPTEGQMYGIVDKCHSHSNIEVYYVVEDMETKKGELMLGLGVMRGKIIKRIKKINSGDIFIVSERDFESVKAGSKPKLDLIHKYTDGERSLIMPQLPQLLRSYIDARAAKIDANTVSNCSDDEITFEDTEGRFKREKAARRYQNNAISTDYLSSMDLPPNSDDEEEEQ